MEETGKPNGGSCTQTVDDVINEIGKSPNILLLAVATLGMSCSYVGCLCAYMVVFTGFIPTENYVCLTKQCQKLQENFTLDSGEIDSKFYDTKTICDSDMILGTDYEWDKISRTTFAVDFDKICNKSQISLLNSLYFVGATIGLLFGTLTFEHLGRRKSALVGGCIVTMGTFLGTFCDGYNFMVLIRLLQGMGNFLAYSGTYIWILEFVPEQYRILYNTWSMMIWAIGYPLLVCICYFIHKWNFIFLACSIVIALTYIPVLIMPDSPRLLMSLGKVEEAKIVLMKYSQLAGKPIDLTHVNLAAGEDASKTNDQQIPMMQRFREIWINKALLLETLVQAYFWFVCCLLFYFLNYGWSSFGDTPYVNYLFAGLGEAIAYIALAPITAILGRKKGLIFCLGISCACFLLGMIPWAWNDVWSFERLMNLAAIIGVSCAFALAFLYTNELAPTTHRGLVMSCCSVVARGAAFVGPFVSDIFGSSTVKLGVNAVLAGTAALITLLLPETRKLAIPEKAEDVQVRRKEQGLVQMCS
ncbi:hypothetical protein ACHWQZ_G005617 [Mnemiopsis leidyi]